MFMSSSIVLVRNGRCQFQFMNVFLFIDVIRWKVSSERINLVGLLSCVNDVKNVWWFLGVCLFVISIVLFYLLLIVMFCIMCSSISSIGVSVLVVVCVGSSLILMVVRFIIVSVIIRVFLWLMWLFQWLNMMLFRGCVKKFMVNVLNEVSVLRNGLLFGKNSGLNMSVVVVVQMQKLYYLIMVLIKVVVVVCVGWCLLG